MVDKQKQSCDKTNIDEHKHTCGKKTDWRTTKSKWKKVCGTTTIKWTKNGLMTNKNIQVSK